MRKCEGWTIDLYKNPEIRSRFRTGSWDAMGVCSCSVRMGHHHHSLRQMMFTQYGINQLDNTCPACGLNISNLAQFWLMNFGKAPVKGWFMQDDTIWRPFMIRYGCLFNSDGLWHCGLPMFTTWHPFTSYICWCSIGCQDFDQPQVIIDIIGRESTKCHRSWRRPGPTPGIPLRCMRPSQLRIKDSRLQLEGQPGPTEAVLGRNSIAIYCDKGWCWMILIYIYINNKYT